MAASQKIGEGYPFTADDDGIGKWFLVFEIDQLLKRSGVHDTGQSIATD